MAVVVTGLLAAGAASAVQAQQPTSSAQQPGKPSGWTFNVAPYLWLPTINATLNDNLPPTLSGGVPTDVSAGPGDVLSHLTSRRRLRRTHNMARSHSSLTSCT